MRRSVRTGSQWSATQAVDQAESNIIRLRDIVGTANSWREGLRLRQQQRWGTADNRERCSMVQDEIRRGEEDVRPSWAVWLAQQGRWAGWNLPDRKLTLHEIWKYMYQPLKLSFLLRSVYDLLPTPANMQMKMEAVS